ncbi:MAG: hypothetical protein Q9181_006582 [Wetmoreana brouardii]
MHSAPVANRRREEDRGRAITGIRPLTVAPFITNSAQAPMLSADNNEPELQFLCLGSGGAAPDSDADSNIPDNEQTFEEQFEDFAEKVTKFAKTKVGYSLANIDKKCVRAPLGEKSLAPTIKRTELIVPTTD